MEKIEKENVVITGITGLLGSTLKIVLEKDYNVYGIGLDISDAKALENYRILGNIDWILHTAAMTDVNRCEKDRTACYNVNVLGTKNVRDLAKKFDAKLLYISTASVFSGEEGNYTEHDIPYPKNFYNLTKLLGEQTVLEYENAIVLRINLIGVHHLGSRGQNFFEWLVDSIKANKDMKLFSDVMINPLSNWTVAECIKKIVGKNPTEKILHISSSNVLSKADIGNLVIKKLENYKGNLETTSVGNAGGPARPKQMWLNAEFTQKEMNWQMPSLENEINKILELSK